MNNMEYFNQKPFLRIPSTHYMKTYTLWMYVKSKEIEIHKNRYKHFEGSYYCCSKIVNLIKKYILNNEAN